MAAIQRIVRKKGTTYRVQIRRKNSKIISKTFSTKKLAQQFANRLESDRQTLLAFGNLTNNTLHLSKLIELYLTNEYYGKYFNKQKVKLDYWLSSIGDKLIVEITSVEIKSVLDDLASHLSNATVNRYKAALSVVFSYAVREYNFSNNPVKNIRSLPENNARIRFLSNSERRALFGACRGSQWVKLYLLVLLAITTGARKGELMNLRWKDVDLDRQTAYIETTKNGQPKVLPLTDEVVAELRRFKDQEPELIFNSQIKPDKPYEFYKLWRKALKEADIKDFTFHSCRHTCASYLAMSGASLLEIADVLNHKQIQVTKRYSHLCISHKSKLINKVMGSL